MRWVLAYGVPGLAALIACSSPTAQPDGMGPGSGPDAGPPPPTPTGRRSYIVTAVVTSTKPTGTIAETPAVNGHELTMELDWVSRITILGSPGDAVRVAFETAPGGLIIRQSVTFISGAVF